MNVQWLDSSYHILHYPVGIPAINSHIANNRRWLLWCSTASGTLSFTHTYTLYNTALSNIQLYYKSLIGDGRTTVAYHHHAGVGTNDSHQFHPFFVCKSVVCSRILFILNILSHHNLFQFPSHTFVWFQFLSLTHRYKIGRKKKHHFANASQLAEAKKKKAGSVQPESANGSTNTLHT